MNVLSIKPVRVMAIILVGTFIVSSLYYLLPRAWYSDFMSKRRLHEGRQARKHLEIPLAIEKEINALAKERKAGLETPGNEILTLNGKPFRILSGAMHYFRIVPEYWEDRMMKLKACGLNTVETYIPWNLHEKEKGQFQFDGILDLRKYILLAQKLGLYVIIRPGPYICNEWEFGGLPSWLLHDPEMQVRTTHQPYLRAVDEYFAQIIPHILDLQYTNGGPIISVQVENEYGAYGNDHKYMEYVRDNLVKHGIKELLFTSDGNGEGRLERGAVEGALATANIQNKAKGRRMFQKLRKLQPEKPLLVSEYWSGWFDRWGEKHHTMSVDNVTDTIQFVLKYGNSIGIFMFPGGTNFGFMNGANEWDHWNGNGPRYVPVVTSYDYDAPLSEAGDITEKYKKIREILLEMKLADNLPPLPPPVKTMAYGTVTMQAFLTLDEMLKLNQHSIQSSNVLPMEMLDINNGGGQGYGFICYRKNIPLGSLLTFSGNVHDRAVIIQEHEEIGVVTWEQMNAEVKTVGYKGTTTLDVLVENTGRVNYATNGSNILNKQRKGLCNPVTLDKQPLYDWMIYPLEFKQVHITMYSQQVKSSVPHPKEPSLYKGYLNVEKIPADDTFIDMQGWTKGNVFLNGFNLGRYWNIIPQKTLYLPGPLLKAGANEFLIFELHTPGSEITLNGKPNIG